MFGSISGWFYKYLAGIRPAPDAVAYNKIILQPAGFEKLRFARADYHSPQGTISSSWRRKGDSLYYDVSVPVNASATVLLPGRDSEHIGSGHYRYIVRLPGREPGH
jgi:alpha-L-rhamnosidase